jgi:branched-chain amino acid aminotransferase
MLIPAETLWLNGELAAREQAGPSIASHTLHYGVGVFDGVMAYRNEDHYYIHFAEEHMARLLSSCAAVGLKVKWSVDELVNAAQELLATLPAADYYLRPLIFRGRPQIALTGEDDLDTEADAVIMAAAVARDVVQEFTCHVSPYERISARAIPVQWKLCAAYANSYLVRHTAELNGFNDGLMLDVGGRVCEASASNIFFVEGTRLVTPALTPEIFPGLTRHLLIELARAQGIDVIERSIYPQELAKFEGAFLAATLMEIKPLKQIGEVSYATKSLPAFHSLLQEFQRITRQ